jgi:hypothetical protein
LDFDDEHNGKSTLTGTPVGNHGGSFDEEDGMGSRCQRFGNFDRR